MRKTIKNNKSRRHLRKTIKRRIKYGGKKVLKKIKKRIRQRGGFFKRIRNALQGGMVGIVNGLSTDSRMYKSPGFQGGSYEATKESMAANTTVGATTGATTGANVAATTGANETSNSAMEGGRKSIKNKRCSCEQQGGKRKYKKTFKINKRRTI